MHSRLKMFNAFVLPYITYCSTVRNDGTSSIIEKLTKLQGKAARAITGESYEVRSTDILQKLNWIPIEKILMKRETIMTFKALTGRSPDYLQDLFRKSENKNYSLRSNNKKLSLPKPRTNFLKQSFSYRAAQRWNELADDITRDIDKLSLTSFIRRL